VRPPGPPALPTDFEQATTMDAPGTRPGETVIWYKGDDAGPSARDTAPVRIDATQVVGTGARANEGPIRTLLAQLGALAADSFANTAVDRERYARLTDEIRSNLSPPAGSPSVADIAVELGVAVSTMQGARERHQAAEAMLHSALDEVENANTEEVAASILQLQTRLQASYQTTSILAGLSLVNYL
jgi:flagellar hook-associated protein 3 FlgL